ncbi:RNA methyltransferase [Sphingobacterium sp. UT-1RO-CII-1]|uniref:methyltransferase RsmF C-terminal domain-like protein n=1 Tax=Sphingobacterium sp. UT-1RO-CII-1 TaxID=2995225 RepID=UPI00227A2266|nr:RNA methyltransferase [Sphingobacterium sp. UT-1RO-CII-1]MCY4780945.1 RNA methyltransferase [Sphingobacterium sp. UT-1RO-CII-1]
MGNFLPNELIRRLNEQYNFDTESFLDSHNDATRITSVRLNPDKPFRGFDSMERVPWSDSGRYLDGRPVFTLDPLFHAGCYYVQEASSMFLEHVIEKIGFKDSSAVALDLCGAPGGKSTLLNSSLGKRSLLVANEVIKTRALVLKENLVRWGNPNIVVSNNDPSAFSNLPSFFDFMLVDAPCSGSGMFRKGSHAIDEWSLAHVKLCSERQQRILSQSINTLKPGGYLVYSTCSYSKEENQDILDWLITEYDLETVRIPIDAEWGIDEVLSSSANAFGYSFFPHKVKGEGFFLGVLKRRMGAICEEKRVKYNFEKCSTDVVNKWVKDVSEYESFIIEGHLHIFPKLFMSKLGVLKKQLYLKDAGTTIGRLSGADLVPSFELAHSTVINEDIQSQEVSLDVALAFLRKQTLDISDFKTVKTGWCLVKYLGVNLGWVKVLSNRINNYYPKELRIMNL